MITKKSIGPVVVFCVWNLIIALTSVSTAATVATVLIVLSSLFMFSDSVRAQAVKSKEEMSVIDTLVHLGLVVWVLSWLYPFQIAFWTYATATVALNAYTYSK